MSYAQGGYDHVSNKSVYEFLDELANEGIIEINSAVKPYPEKLVLKKLVELINIRDSLSVRQKEELFHYARTIHFNVNQTEKQKEFIINWRNLDAVYFNSDTPFVFRIRPIIGMEYYSTPNGNIFHRRNGAEFSMLIHGKLGVYASLRDNHHSKMFIDPSYLDHNTGVIYKGSSDAGDFSEMRGGVTYDWKWGRAAFVKDHIAWGNAYNGSNIFSEKTPSFAQFKLNLNPVDWFELNYMHAWLVSEVIDSNRIYTFTNPYGTKNRMAFYPKFLAANMFTVKPWKGINISLGNSVIYSSDNVIAAYLIPVMFFKSVDHTLNGASNLTGQNSQMFFDLSIRKIKHLHLYSTLFVDEISLNRMFDKEKHSNFISTKIGGRLSNYPVKNLSLTAEYTKTNPLAYQHIVPTTTFASNMYNLGHYLRDNSKEIYLALTYKPFAHFRIHTYYLKAQKGEDYNELGGSRWGLPFMEEVKWENQTIGASVSYELFFNSIIGIDYQYSNISGDDIEKYTHEYFRGKNHIFTLKATIGI